MSADAPAGRNADAIVVAAGASRRTGDRDKLEYVVVGRPLLAHALDAIAACPLVGTIVVVTTAERRDELAAAPWLPASVGAVVVGGASRHVSVRRGFEALESLAPDPRGDRIVLVHDGARPAVSVELVTASVGAATEFGAAIPAVVVAETVKRVNGTVVTATVDRSDLVLAQTPQAMRRSILRAALAQVDSAPDGTRGTDWTDEAALLEACRIPVHVFPGEPTNIKVTVPADLDRVADLLAARRPGRRSGIGHDTHPFGPGAPLRLGGLVFEGVPRLYGHSDGDVVLHAIADALLGAAGLGDLGRLFPSGPSTRAGVESTELLADVIDRLAAEGWRPIALDLTIVGARPRLGDRLDAMRDAIATHLGLPAGEVNVKASTGNLDGSEGAGRSISALALATIGVVS